VVSLSSSDVSASVPATVTVAAGSTSAKFNNTTTSVAAATTVTISASYGGITKPATLTVNPITISAVSLSPTAIAGGMSSSASSVSLSGPAPATGAVVTLSSSDASASVPAAVTVAAGATSAKFNITTTSVAAATSVTVSASYGGITKTAILTVNPVALSSVTLSPGALVGGVPSSNNWVYLSAPAPSTGAVVTLSSSDASASVPAAVTVAVGATSAKFNITTSSVAAATSVTISAAYGGVTKTATLTVKPVAVSMVTLSPAALVGGMPSSNNWVYVGGPAPSGGAVVTLSSSDPSVAVPATVIVPAGATYAKFGITTASVAATRSVTVSAAYGGVTKSATLTVNPVVVSSLILSPTSLTGGASSIANTVYLNGPAPSGGAVVSLSSSDPSAIVPAAVTIAAGATSVKFNITTTSVAASTSVTISAAYGGVTIPATLTVN